MENTEYLTIYRGPDFLEGVWFDSMPTPFSPSILSATGLYFSDFLCVVGRAYVGEGKDWKGGRGAESYDRKEAWPFINHSITYSLAGEENEPSSFHMA